MLGQSGAGCAARVWLLKVALSLVVAPTSEVAVVDKNDKGNNTNTNVSCSDNRNHSGWHYDGDEKIVRVDD